MSDDYGDIDITALELKKRGEQSEYQSLRQRAKRLGLVISKSSKTPAGESYSILDAENNTILAGASLDNALDFITERETQDERPDDLGVKCQSCGMDIPAEAKICPYCRIRTDERLLTREEIDTIRGVIVLAIIIIIVAAALYVYYGLPI